MTKLLALILTLFALVSCAGGGHTSKRDKTHVAPNGGVVVKGKIYYLEIVSSEKHVHLYPLQENEQGQLEPISTKNIRVTAEYSPYHSKADYSLNLSKRHGHYHGKVDTHGEKSYEIHVDMQVGKTREEFSYDLKSKDLKHKHATPTVSQ